MLTLWLAGTAPPGTIPLQAALMLPNIDQFIISNNAFDGSLPEVVIPAGEGTWSGPIESARLLG